MLRAVTSLCSRTNTTCRAEGTVVRIKQVNDKFIDSLQLYYSKKVIQRGYQVAAGSLEGVYIGLHSDESYFCVRIVSKPLGKALMLKPELEILHSCRWGGWGG